MNNQAEPVMLPEDEVEAIPQAIEVPCVLQYDPESGHVSIGCAAQDLEDFLGKTLEAHDHD